MQTKPMLAFTMMCSTIVFVAVNLCFGQIYWKRSYGDTLPFHLADIKPTTDGNFLMVGWDLKMGYGADKGLIKIKPNGNTIWMKKYSFGRFHHGFYAIQPTNDGNFLIIGPRSSYCCVVKIKPDGDTIWTKTYNGVAADGSSAIQPTTDGNFLIVGYAQPTATELHGWLIKIKPNGDTCWTRTYRGTGDGMFTTVQSCSDGNLLIVGSTWLKTGNGVWLLKVKPNGDTLWTKTFHKSSGGRYFSDSFNALRPTSDGNFLLAGFIYTSNIDSSSSWLLKIKPDGETIWDKTNCGALHNAFYDIRSTRDGNYLIAGSILTNETRGLAGWIAKIKPNGDTLWSKTYDRPWDERFSKIQPTGDGNFLLLCDSYSREGSGCFLVSLIDDQYAYKNNPFTFKIPAHNINKPEYVPLKVPSGMTVSSRGVISWTPKSDSIYMEQVEYLVRNDMNIKDTLSFNVFVNSCCQKPEVVNTSQISKAISIPFDFAVTTFPGYVKFNLTSTAAYICIYDVTGRMIDKVNLASPLSGTCIVWPGVQSSRSKIHSGKYFARAIMGGNSIVKTFVLTR